MKWIKRIGLVFFSLLANELKKRFGSIYRSALRYETTPDQIRFKLRPFG
jgi:hypothetical protein